MIVIDIEALVRPRLIPLPVRKPLLDETADARVSVVDSILRPSLEASEIPLNCRIEDSLYVLFAGSALRSAPAAGV
jgi:hypothetical protein